MDGPMHNHRKDGKIMGDQNDQGENLNLAMLSDTFHGPTASSLLFGHAG